MPQVHYTTLKDSTLGTRTLRNTVATLPLLPGAIHSQPAVAFNPASGNPGFAWESTQPGANGPESTLWFQERGLEERKLATTSGHFEFPTVTFDALGLPYVAWVEVRGSKSALWAAAPDESGALRTRSLNGGGRLYDVMPTLFPHEYGADLRWFSISGEAALPYYARLNTDALFSVTTDERLAALPANRLPVLFQQGDAISAYWTEPTEVGDRMYQWTGQGDTGRARLTRLAPPQGLTANATAVSNDGLGTFLWIGTDAQGPALVIEGAATVRIPADASASDAVLTTSRNFLHAIWVNDPGHGGNGALEYWRQPLREAGK